MKTLGTLIVVAALLGTNALVHADEALSKRVRRLDPGTRVKIAVDGAAPMERYFVKATDNEVVVLNLGAEGLPKGQLVSMTKDNPDWMANTSKAIYKDNSVRVGPDGVFVRDKKVASLADVVEHIPMTKISDVQK
jgi:hypothetical protein